MTGMRGRGREADQEAGGGGQGQDLDLGQRAGDARGTAEAGVEIGAGINPRVVTDPEVARRARRDPDQTQDTNERSLPLAQGNRNC